MNLDFFGCVLPMFSNDLGYLGVGQTRILTHYRSLMVLPEEYER